MENSPTPSECMFEPDEYHLIMMENLLTLDLVMLENSPNQSSCMFQPDVDDLMMMENLPTPSMLEPEVVNN